MAWFRLHEGAFSDAKWPIVARKANTNVGTVVSIWVALLDYASKADERGSLEDFDCETVDALYGYEEGTSQRVLDAMTEKGLIIDGAVANWKKRQPEREDNSSTERSRQFRAKQKLQRDATQCNDMQRNETQCNDLQREETRRNAPDTDTEYIKTPPIPPQGGNGGDAPENAGGKSGAHGGTEKTGQDAKKPKKPKREPTGNTAHELEAAIDAHTSNPALRKTLREFRAMRERIRKPLTGHALDLAVAELEKLAPGNDAMKIAILDQSILNSWQGLFELRGAARHPPRDYAMPVN